MPGKPERRAPAQSAMRLCWPKWIYSGSGLPARRRRILPSQAGEINWRSGERAADPSQVVSRGTAIPRWSNAANALISTAWPYETRNRKT